MSINTKKRRHPTASSPHESDDDNGEQPSSSSSQVTNKRRGSVAADFAPPRLIVSERQQMAVLKQLIAGDESNTGSQSPSSLTPQPRPNKINRRNEHGETIVHIAARKGDLKQLKKVLKAGANVNEADNAGWTPLHEAVTKNQFKAARLLLKSGAYSNAPGPEGQTPLVDAVLNNNTKMAELLLNYSADPSVVDLTRLNENMAKVLQREMTVLDSSDNENDDESTSPLSPLTSDNDLEHDDKQNFHSTLVEKLDKNILQASTTSKLHHKKRYQRIRERSSQSSDSSPHSKTRTVSGNNETSTATTTNKNPYDFESDEEGEIRETTTESSDEQKKKTVRKQDSTKQHIQNENLNQTTESTPLKKRPNKIDLINKETDSIKFESTLDEKQLQHIYRVPPLKIVLARAVLQRTPETESCINPGNMDDEDTNDNCLTIDTSLQIPIIQENDKLLSSLSSNVPMQTSKNNSEEEDEEEDEENHQLHEENSSSQISQPESESTQSPQTISSIILNTIINQIELENSQLNSLPIVEDDQIEPEDEDEDEENEDDEEETEEQENPEKSSESKTTKIGKDRSNTKSTLSKDDSKPTTRTLRSHARKKLTLTMFNPASFNINNNTRRVSNRRRALDNKLSLATHEKEKKRKTIVERTRKDKESTNDDIQTSSNSDDQTIETTHADKVTNPNDDASSCSSIGAGDGSSTSSSTVNMKQANLSTDIDFLPPNKRRLRERNAAFPSTSTVDSSAHSDHSPVETTNTREIPTNSIKQFLEIRQQIAKRHNTLLHDYVLPKFPKDFSETTMARRSYLVAPAFTSYSSTTTPAAIGIRRYAPPEDLDPHLAEVFAKQEDERYRMKLRHQVERDKLILSYEQEVLRLCGNATRSSMNQDIPLSYCSLLKDDEVYNNPSTNLPEKLMTSDYNNVELGKRVKHRWNGRSFIKWLEDSNLKYKRLSCELNERQRLEAETLYSMQRMVWLKHLPKESTNSASSGRTSYLLTERYLPKVDIISNFWTNWETNPF